MPRTKLRYLQPNFTSLGLQLAFVVAGSGVTARFAAFVTLRIAKPICLGIQQRVHLRTSLRFEPVSVWQER